MGYSQSLRKLFPGITLEAEDLLLLETFQIRYLPDRALDKEFAVLLRDHPVVHRFLETKYPPIAEYLNTILSECKPTENKDASEKYCQEALWEIADLILYNKSPELYATQVRLKWDISEITSITSFEGKTIADVGAGSGRIAFMLAEFAKNVFAVEPVSSFRRFIREKAARENVNNLFVVDGFLDSIPLPDNSLDVLLTSNAMGWNLEDELPEIERVLKPKAHAIHLFLADAGTGNPLHDVLVSPPWNYLLTGSEEDGKMKQKYFKTV